MDTEIRTVKANGITLTCRAWGPEDAPPVLLLHCRGADGADWTPIAERLATGAVPYRVYAPDLRGHGTSDWPGPMWWDHMGRITMPTLVIAGGPTSGVPQDRVAVLAERIPDARLVTVDAGHLVHESRPEEFLALVEAFLVGEEVTSRRPS